MDDNERQQSYAAVLADIERKIADLQRTEANIRLLMSATNGESGMGEGENAASPIPQGPRRDGPIPADPLALVKVGDFYGKSYAEAAREFLRRAKAPQTTVTILNAMRKTQFPMQGKNPASSLYTTLKRHQGFHLVTRNTWGLAEWYPDVEKKRPEPKKVRRSARPKKSKSEQSQGESKESQ